MWHAKVTGAYARDSVEAKDNALMLANAMNKLGWSTKSIAAMLGNGAGESGLNPWRWESDNVPTYAAYQSWSKDEARSHGYGLFGFTPASKYIENAKSYSGYGPNFSDRSGLVTDGASQTQYFGNTVASSWMNTNDLYSYYYDDFINIGVNIDDFYYMTFDTFKSGNATIEELTGAFELCYERPADWAAASSYNSRVDNAKYWLNIISSNISTNTIWTRNSLPEKHNPYYNNSSSPQTSAKYSTCITGQYAYNHIGNGTTGAIDETVITYYGTYGLNVLRNCVGQAWGAFNECYNKNARTVGEWHACRGGGGEIYNYAKDDSFLSKWCVEKTGMPPLGGLIDGSGHVAFISEVHYGNSDGSPSPSDWILINESGWNSTAAPSVPIPDILITDYNSTTNGNVSQSGWRRRILTRGVNSTWQGPNDGWNFTSVNGFIANPAIGFGPFLTEQVTHDPNYTPGEQPEPELPKIYNIQSMSVKQIKIRGSVDGGKNTSGIIYIKWNSNVVSSKNFDLSRNVTGDFTIYIDKPLIAKSVAVLIVRSSTQGEVARANNLYIPCIYIYNNNGKWTKAIPYIFTSSGWKPCTANVKTSTGWAELWTT